MCIRDRCISTNNWTWTSLAKQTRLLESIVHVTWAMTKTATCISIQVIGTPCNTFYCVLLCFCSYLNLIPWLKKEGTFKISENGTYFPYFIYIFSHCICLKILKFLVLSIALSTWMRTEEICLVSYSSSGSSLSLHLMNGDI